jgi:hypothetical protein
MENAMSRLDSATTSRTRLGRFRRSIGGGIDSIIRRCGLASADRPFAGVETLENRILLADDHPNFGQVFNTLTPLPVVNILLNGSGAGSASGIIETTGDNDMFRFTAPANDFVRIWADTINAESGNSTLDSHVQVWIRNPNTSGTLVAGGADQGTLTQGFFSDGWAGFVATAGQEYFIRVLSNRTSGVGSTGDYVVRVNTLSTNFNYNATTGEGTAAGTIVLPGSDRVFKVTGGSDPIFDSVATAYGDATDTVLDTRIDVYNSNGVRIAFDSDGGNLSNAYTAFKSAQNRTFYVRVRSDKFRDPANNPAAGPFTLKLDMAATQVTTDPVTRYFFNAGQALPDEKTPQLFQFLAQGTGLSFVTIFPTGLFPIADSGVHIYDETGAQIGFNELPGAASQLEIQLTGGKRYWFVVETFDLVGGGGQYGIEIEAHHTFNTAIPIDDHVNTPPEITPQGGAPAFGTPEYESARRQFERATPIVWGDAEAAPDPINGGTISDRAKVVRGFARGRIYQNGDTDLFQFVPPMDMLGNFQGTQDPTLTFPPDPPQWLPDYRPASRLQIYVNGGPLFNSQVRVFDSNFNLVYDTNQFVLTPGFPDPSGMLDPSSWPPGLPLPFYGFTFAGQQPAGIPVWGGEVYYLEVSSEAGTGTYSVEVQADAREDDYTSILEGPAQAGQWANAYELPVNTATGDTRNYVNASGGQTIGQDPFIAVPGGGAIMLGRAWAMNLTQPVPPPAGTGANPNAGFPTFATPGSRGRVILQLGDFATLTRPDDVDLYQFRATYTGTAEIRINTTNIVDEFFEQMVQTEDGNPLTPPVFVQPTRRTKTYSSPLDSALRVFNNDFIQLAYNNDNAALDGEFGTFDTGTFTDRRFYRRDARAVINVEAGKTYFIQVESGQKAAFETGDGVDVDWRHAIGSYELLVNAMPNLNFIDDHANAGAANATVIPMNMTPGSAGNGTGTITGVIQNNAQFNPVDVDLFKFIAPASGNARVTITATTGTLAPAVAVTRLGNVIAQGAGATGGAVTVNFSATQGDVIFILVGGANTTSQGGYRVDVANLPFADDHGDTWHTATVIPANTYDYSGIATIPGSIENPGDVDVFRFETIGFDVARIRVNAVGQFDPVVEVYEVSDDGVGNPVFLRVAYNDDIAPGNLSSEVLVSLTGPDRVSGSNGLTLNNYYIVVSGFNSETTAGSYNLVLQVTPTDDHPDAGQFSVATPINLAIPTGLGNSSGNIEKTGDTDIFQFTAGAQGTATVTVTSPSSSALRQGVRIFDNNFNPVTDLISGQTLVLGLDSSNSTATFRFVVQRNTTYYVVVQGGPLNPGFVNKTKDFGRYTVGVTSPVLDDHANETEFPYATNIPLSIVSGDGSASGRLEINTDTDLFTFRAIANGNMVVTVGRTTNSFFTPVVRLFRGDTSEIGSAVTDGGPGDEDGLVNGSVTRTISAAAINDVYYVLVQSSPGGFVLTGSYNVTLDGNPPPHDPNDDYPNAGDFPNAQLITLSTLTGNGSISGGIQFTGDTDLFTITSFSSGRAYVNVVTAQGVALNAKVTIFGPQQGIIASDSQGYPGVNAAVTFNINGPGQKYWILVEGVGGSIGDYTVNVDTPPAVFTLYYPEGFASRTIREFIALENPNNFGVTYTVRLRYEDPNLPEVVVAQNATINPHTRDGLTLSNGTASPLHGITFGKPYAIIVEANGPLGASLSHYDFDSSLGENFTDRTSTTWTFARGERFPGAVRDFLLFYNPNPTAVLITLTAYGEDGSTTVLTQTVQGLRRSGWAFNQVSTLPIGAFSFTVTSAPVNSSDPHVGIVAALSHYDLINTSGDASLGDPDAGAFSGVIPGTINGGPVQTTISFYNPTTVNAIVTINGNYFNSGLPDFVRTITIAAHRGVTLSGAQLGLVDSQPVGMRYDANTRITALVRSVEFGDGTGTQASTDAATGFFFGDGFINTAKAGILYFENLNIYNPASQNVNVTVKILFTNGDTATTTVSVAGNDYAQIKLHELQAILSRGGNQFFSLELSAPTPIAATMDHFDLFLAGGWSTKGSPIGLVTPISAIS